MRWNTANITIEGSSDSFRLHRQRGLQYARQFSTDSGLPDDFLEVVQGDLAVLTSAISCGTGKELLRSVANDIANDFHDAQDYRNPAAAKVRTYIRFTADWCSKGDIHESLKECEYLQLEVSSQWFGREPSNRRA